MVTMAEVSDKFQMHHYQQVSKDKPKDGCGLNFKMSCDRGLLRNISGKSKDPD